MKNKLVSYNTHNFRSSLHFRIKKRAPSSLAANKIGYLMTVKKRILFRILVTYGNKMFTVPVPGFIENMYSRNAKEVIHVNSSIYTEYGA